MTQLIEADPSTVVASSGFAVDDHVLSHLELLEGLQIRDAHDDGRQLPIAGDADTLSRVHGPAKHIRQSRAKLAGCHLIGQCVHSKNCIAYYSCVHAPCPHHTKR